ncbi:MAG: hypothetical protein DRR19_33000, partial [Candidatus Parabeggiatoa sp. nov. 1]
HLFAAMRAKLEPLFLLALIARFQNFSSSFSRLVNSCSSTNSIKGFSIVSYQLSVISYQLSVINVLLDHVLTFT